MRCSQSFLKTLAPLSKDCSPRRYESSSRNSLKPKLRLGYTGTEEIKEHPFFENIDWFKLERRGIDPPYKPRLNGDYDLSNIDRVKCD